MVDPDLLPGRLPLSHHWAILLVRLKSSEDMEEMAFFGERVLVGVEECEENLLWTGRLLRKSQFAPSLEVGAALKGIFSNGFHVIHKVQVDSGYEAILNKVESIPRGSFFSMFFASKEGQFLDLKAANIFCANPSCPMVFSKTWSQREDDLRSAGPKLKNLGADDSITIWTCNICGTSRVVDQTSFDELFKV